MPQVTERLRIRAQDGSPGWPTSISLPLPLLPPIRNGIFILSFGTQSPGNPLCNSSWLTEHRKGSSLEEVMPTSAFHQPQDLNDPCCQSAPAPHFQAWETPQIFQKPVAWGLRGTTFLPTAPLSQTLLFVWQLAPPNPDKDTQCGCWTEKWN